MLNETKKLHELGFAIHLLQPKSKRPVESKWTSGDRKTWTELKKNFKSGMNVGVRLGKASDLGGGYLAVVDCDVKATDEKSSKEMRIKLQELFGSSIFADAPCVASGRGNGSMHYYGVTDKPIGSNKLASSDRMVKVKMPSSIKPSPRDRAGLSEAELKAGYRIRPAWEISLMGEGTQVVLPPSIHPDSDKPYVWVKPFEPGIKAFAIHKGVAVTAPAGTTVQDFKTVPIDVELTSLNERIVKLIMGGDDCVDRSAGLMSACLAMLRIGLSDNEILTVLTDPKLFLGQAAYEHAQTPSRARAAAWIKKYTLAKAKREIEASHAFREECVETKLSEEDAEVQSVELAEATHWKAHLERTTAQEGAKVKSTLKNLILILQNEVGKLVWRRDEFSNLSHYGCTPPWRAKSQDRVEDDDIVRIKHWFAEHYGIEPGDDKISQAITYIADCNRYHPVRDYLDSLEWDGLPRVNSWLKTYLRASDADPYLSAVSRKVLCAMTARVYDPGCKFDHVLILEGIQGTGKSSAAKILAGEKWHSDSTLLFSDKDSVLAMSGKWIMELGELAGMDKQSAETLKAFVSRQADDIRKPYGRMTQEIKRQCIFIGTTNKAEYLKDDTGGRRFWPVTVGQTDFDGLARDRDQLLAEAKLLWQCGEPLWLESEEVRKQAMAIQEIKTFSDSMAEALDEFFAEQKAKGGFEGNNFTMSELTFALAKMQDCKWETLRQLKTDRGTEMRLNACLQRIGFKQSKTNKQGLSVRVWRRVTTKTT